jgi:hypothetical protein
MVSYYPVTICRSDGLFEFFTKTGLKDLNQPTASQLDDTPDADGIVDCYKKLDNDHPKTQEWRRKLGGMMMKLLGGDAHAGMTQYQLFIRQLTPLRP